MTVVTTPNPTLCWKPDQGKLIEIPEEGLGNVTTQKTIRDRQHERIVKKRKRLELGSKGDKAPSVGMGFTRRWAENHFGLLRRPINRRNLIMTMMSVPLE